MPGRTLPQTRRLAKGYTAHAVHEDRGAPLDPPQWTAQVVLPSQRLVGGALCRAEPSHTCGWCPMPGGTLHHWWLARPAGEATSEEASQGATPHKVARSARRPGHGTRREHPQRPPFISIGDRSTRGRGMGGTGEGERVAKPPPPKGAPAGPVSTPAAAPTPSP